MIKFFRNIRQNMVHQNRTKKYLLYAIGEIILVVIGILIALQINNWNEGQKDAKQEKLILRNLNLEFQNNLRNLRLNKKLNTDMLASTKILIGLVGEPEDVLNSYNLDSLISESINYTDYSPSESVLSDLISSGRLNLISSDSLRIFLFDWASNLEEKEEAWQTLDDMNQNLILPYLTKNASLKNIDSYGILNWHEKSKLNPKTNGIFKDIEFENNLDNHAWCLTNYLIALENLEKSINQIIIGTENLQEE